MTIKKVPALGNSQNQNWAREVNQTINHLEARIDGLKNNSLAAQQQNGTTAKYLQDEIDKLGKTNEYLASLKTHAKSGEDTTVTTNATWQTVTKSRVITFDEIHIPTKRMLVTLGGVYFASTPGSGSDGTSVQFILKDDTGTPFQVSGGYETYAYEETSAGFEYGSTAFAGVVDTDKDFYTEIRCDLVVRAEKDGTDVGLNAPYCIIQIIEGGD